MEACAVSSHCPVPPQSPLQESWYDTFLLCCVLMISHFFAVGMYVCVNDLCDHLTFLIVLPPVYILTSDNHYCPWLGMFAVTAGIYKHQLHM